MGFFYFLPGCLLALFLKTIEEHHQITFIKTAEYSVYIAAERYPDFIQAICPSHMLKELYWNPVQYHHQIQNLVNFVLDLPWQLIEEISKMVPVKNQCSLLIHYVKLTNNGT